MWIPQMNSNNLSKNNFVLEEESIINWSQVQLSFQKNFGLEIYNSWLSKLSLINEYHDYLVLEVPTKFFRDWIVSRYLDKILEEIKKNKGEVLLGYNSNDYVYKTLMLTSKEPLPVNANFFLGKY